MIFNNFDPIFLGAFWGAFFSFLFYILSYFLPKLLKKVSFIIKTRRRLHKLYDSLLFSRNKESIYKLIELFSFQKIKDIMKGSVLEAWDRIQFNNADWEILIANIHNQTKIFISDYNDRRYCFDHGVETGFKVLLELLEYIEKACNKTIYKIKINKKRKKGKAKLKDLIMERNET